TPATADVERAATRPRHVAQQQRVVVVVVVPALGGQHEMARAAAHVPVGFVAMKKALLAALSLSLCACSVVKMHRVRDDYLAIDASQTRRLALVVSPLPDGSQKAGELFATLARKYIHQKRDYFYVKKSLAQSSPIDAAQVCAG